MTKAHPDREDWGPCQYADCDNFVAIRKYGVCNKHYRLAKRLEGVSRGLDLEAARGEFWKYVDVRSPDECWRWRKAPHVQGHGTFWQNNVSYHAHVISYRLEHGDIPVGMLIDHKCRNRICVNPNHLHAVTPKENTENIDLYRNNPSGYRGVTPRGNGKWRARVGHHGQVVHIGDFDSPEEANEAVVAARLRMHTNNLIDRGESYG